MDIKQLQVAEDAIGFLYPEEGSALYRAGLDAARVGPLLEIGGYCGKSAVYLGAAAAAAGAILYSVDLHTGSEEHQPGEEFFDPRLIDPASGRVNTLPHFLDTIHRADLDPAVVPLVGSSQDFALLWSEPLGLVFIDGGHSEEAAHADLEGWEPHIAPGGLLAIHDVFVDEREGGQAPRHVYERARGGGLFVDHGSVRTLRILKKRQ